MNQITSVFQHNESISMVIKHPGGRETWHLIKFSNLAQRSLFSLVISYLYREAARKHGFFCATTYGWHWLRYTESRGA